MLERTDFTLAWSPREVMTIWFLLTPPKHRRVFYRKGIHFDQTSICRGKSVAVNDRLGTKPKMQKKNTVRPK